MPVNNLPLLVHDIVILDELLADIEVVPLHLGLGVFNGPADHIVLDGLAFLHTQFFHDTGNPLAAEYAQEIIFEGKIKSRGTGISLPSGPAAQLIVDATAFMSFGAENVKSTQIRHAFAQDDIRPPSRHIGGNCHGTHLTCLSDDFGLFLVIFGIENRVFDAPFFQFFTEIFRNVDGNRAHQNRLSRFIQFDNFV